MDAKKRIIVALDVDTSEKAIELVEALKDDVDVFKVGLELVNSAGISILDTLKLHGASKLFYDCKFHDISNTVAGAARAATKLGVWMFNVHCSGGVAMMKAAKDASLETAAKIGIEPPKVIGVTLLTSIDQLTMNNELHIQGWTWECVVHLTNLALDAGLDGVVASPREIEPIRATCGSDFLIVTPGVRPAGADVNDQKRVMTPGEAIKAGADYLVIGRPITAADDPVTATKKIIAEIAEVL